MAHKRTRSRPHAEFRHRSQIPMPAVEEVEQRLLDVLSPSLLAPRQLARRDPRQPQRLIRMRQRLLTLPVIVAIIVSGVAAGAVHRRGTEGLGARRLVGGRRCGSVPRPSPHGSMCCRRRCWASSLPRSVRACRPSRPAPAASQLGTGAGGVPPHRPGGRLGSAAHKDAAPAAAGGAGVGRQSDGAGEAFSHRPLWHLDTAAALANDKRFAAAILGAARGRAVALRPGVCQLSVVRRLHHHAAVLCHADAEKIAYRPGQVLSQGPLSR